jgi:DNA-binding transcriptional ArsR family regulator
MRDPVTTVFTALADPSRRFMIERLAVHGRATPTELAGELPVTRQAVTKHLTALLDAGLVERARSGRETVYTLTPEPLESATTWLERVGAEWDDRLAALARHVDGAAQPGGEKSRVSAASRGG